MPASPDIFIFSLFRFKHHRPVNLQGLYFQNIIIIIKTCIASNRNKTLVFIYTINRLLRCSVMTTLIIAKKYTYSFRYLHHVVQILLTLYLIKWKVSLSSAKYLLDCLLLSVIEASNHTSKEIYCNWCSLWHKCGFSALGVCSHMIIICRGLLIIPIIAKAM